ncbi:hypothetical protein FE257_011515 [Aspergillus nanangensis]|uniref:Terpenoid synthase n=1 Tax=Aspergillus nanangensis TaxID=2582783 RepID=A0AAD4CH37_ASPNN|nr:hypothetical protein FE257_011515 [Aspergillus nanangensis]
MIRSRIFSRALRGPLYFQVRTYTSQPLREILYAFDPVTATSAPGHSDHLSFLNPSAVSEREEFQHVNPIRPATRGVPWPTSFPGALESRYWAEAEEVARHFAQTALTDNLPKGENTKYLDAAVDSAVSFAVYATPMGGLARMKILAKAYVLLFMHDDSANRGYYVLAKEVLSEGSPAIGQRLLDGILSWASQTTKSRPDHFSSLEDYMAHRVEDVGAYPIFRTVEFACGVHLSQAYVHALYHLQSLCAKHFLLTNDLYSYAKEAVAEQTNGKPLFNAVRVVQDLMCVSVPSAKAILRYAIRDMEQSIGQEYKRLVETKPNPSQLVFARGLVAAIAGNIFFSATSGRT